MAHAAELRRISNHVEKLFTHGHAVIIGVGSDLPATVTDAKGIADILRDKGRCAYPSSQVHLLTDVKADRDNVLSELEAVSKEADSESTVVVYYSGHGYRIGQGAGARYYLMPFGYNPDKLDETAISGSDFTEAMRLIKAKKLLLLLDCCHAGGLDDAKAPGLDVAKAPLPRSAQNLLADGSGRVIIASSKEDELSFAGKPYSAFTLALIEALSGKGVAKEDGFVRVADMAMYAHRMVPQRTADRQHPILNFEKADNFVLAYYAGGDEKPKGLTFNVEPSIEPEPGAWTLFDQKGQTVENQMNIANPTGGFFQQGWKVSGDVNQAAGDITINKESRRRARRDEND